MLKENKGFPNGTYIFCWGGVIKNAGGMTRAMLKRANVFLQHNIDVRILLSARGEEQLDGVEHYRKNGYSYIRENMFITLEDFFANKLSKEDDCHNVHLYQDLLKYPFEQICNKKRFYKDGRLYAVEDVQDIARKKLIEFYDEKGVKQYEGCYWDGYLRRIHEYKDQSLSLKKTRYFANNGFCYMCIDEVKENTWKVSSVMLFSEKDLSVRTFNSLDTLREYFFNEYVKTIQNDNIFVFCDPILDFNPGFKDMHSEEKNIYRIAVNHGVGFGGERQWYSQINPRIRDLIEQKYSPDLEAFILLTQEALSDFRKRLGNRNILYNIPNTVYIPEKIPDFSGRDINKVVYIGRFDDKQKQITHIIKAWAKVEKVLPNAELHIYGRGEDEDKINSCIIENNLKHVFIEPFTNDVNTVYQQAVLSVTTSDFEGFSLSLLESFANGCPNVTYNFKYGPNDLMDHEKSGLIVEKNNIDELANAIINLLNNPAVLCSMSNEARKKIEQFNEEKYLDNWLNVLISIVENNKLKTLISKVDFTLFSYRVDKITNIIELKGELQLQGSVPEEAREMEKIYIRIYNNDKTDFSINKVDFSETEPFCYLITAELPINAEIMSICIEWNNSFAEQEIEL